MKSKQQKRSEALARFTRRAFQDYKHQNETQADYDAYLKRKQVEFNKLTGKDKT